MNISFLKSRLFLLFAIPFFVGILSASIANGQIISYTSDSAGALNTIATHATGTALSRVNGSVRPATPCTNGFSSRSYSTATTYANTLAAIETGAAAATGYTLNVTAFSVGLRRSATGPASVRLAYSINGGTTWVDQGSNQAPNNTTTCDSIITATWTTSFAVAAPNTLKFRVYGFNASSTAGTFQIMNLLVNGSVASSTACGVPASLSASSITSSSATLNWGAATGATSYNIQYKTTAAMSWTTTTSTTNTKSLTGLVAGTAYQFQVQTVCASGTSSYSTASTFTTTTCLVPSGLSSSSVTSSTALVSWTAVSGATGYTLGYRVTGTTTWTTVAATTASTTLSGLTAGTAYDIEVATVCTGGGTSPWTSIANFTTLTLAGCSVPSALTSSSITSSTATLSWAAVSGATSYNIQYRTTGGTSTPPWTSTTATTNSKSLTGLASSSTYEFQVQTACTSGTSSFTTSATFTTLSCLAPTGLAASATTTSGATITWTAVTGATGYHLNYRITGTTTWTTVSPTTNTYSLTGLAAATSYDYEVQTVCTGGGSSIYSTVGAFTTLAVPTCGITSSLGSSSITSSSATLSWVAVSGATSYNIQYRPTGTTTWSTTTATTNSVGLSGLSASTTYEYQVQTVCASGTSSFTASATFVTLGACGIPSGFAASAITTTTATLSWAAATGAVSYKIQYRISGTTTWTITTSSTTSVAVTGLTSGSTYEFQVQTVCTSGTSGFSASTLFSTLPASTGNKFTYYFSQPVDTSVRTGTPAVYLHSCLADTLIAYFNRAKYNIDIAQYEYTQGVYSNLATAINAAYTRGVKIRWIYDGAATNTGMTALNAGIHTLGSPTTSAYNIMHNKFVIIDGKSTNPNDALVWTGSADWTTDQFNKDFNNIVIVQDSALAHAYLAEFNMMWGDTGIAPNTTVSKFGPYKTDLGHHSFSIGGKTVELYFSPSDGTNSHIQNTINTANTDMYFGMYTFSDNTDASLIVSRQTAGVYVAGIDDSYSNSYTPYTTFTSGLGSMFKVYTGTGLYPYIYHNKYLIVDPSNTCSDPLVLTGSHNWTATADTKNDENILIIHDASAANIYYQAFHKDFITMGGTLSHVSATSGCGTTYLKEGENGVSDVANENDNFSVYPNPSTGSFTIAYGLATRGFVSVSITDFMGKTNYLPVTNEYKDAGNYSFQFDPAIPGIYIIKMQIGDKVYIGKMVKI